jgi:hypothetical protein
MAGTFSRRAFLGTAGAAAAGLSAAELDAAPLLAPAAPTPLAERIALSDLRYDAPVARSEEGIPIGNGRMGTLVWTTPSRLRFQVNRVDVYPGNAASDSFYDAHNDHCGGCAFLDIVFAGRPFAPGKVRQHLSVHDGVLTIDGDGVSVAIVPSRSADVFAIAIRDRRAGLGPVTAVTRNHLATSALHVEDGCVALTQDFREGDHRCRSAVVAGFGDAGAIGEIVGETEVSLTQARSGEATLYIASAAAIGQDGDALASARSQLERGRRRGFAAIADETRQWWHGFWEQGSVALASADGSAQRLQQAYHWFLYLMASTSSGGAYPPKFNGMLWNTGGDLRAWGAQHWYTNLSCYYEALPASGRFALMDPMFDMYSNMAESCAAAARDVWGSQGLFIAETVYFDGLEPLPAAIAAELRALNLEHKPWAERSRAFLDHAATRHPYSSLWNWKAPGQWKQGVYVTPERGQGGYGPTSHIFAAGAKVAYLFWQRYEFTLDRAWLRTRAYPMLRGAVEFYRHHPRLAKGADGRWHLSGANNSEPVRGARDTHEDMSAIRGVTAALLRASELLGVDSDQRPAWRDLLDHIAPLPMTDDADALGRERLAGARGFAAARAPAAYANPAYLRPDPNSLAAWFFDLCGVEARDPALVDAAQATFDALLASDGPAPGASVIPLSKLAIAAAQLGRAQEVRRLLPNQIEARPFATSRAYRKGGALANRMVLWEGAQALAAEHLGRAAQALQLALLQSSPAAPGEAPVLHLFPAWPADWEARFTLHARGGFVVEASVASGRVAAVSILSKAGAPCTLRNPFDRPAILRREGRAEERLEGQYLRFATAKGERIRIAPVA